jgi:hypothetical protein
VLSAAGLAGLMALWFACGGTREPQHPSTTTNEPASEIESAERDPLQAPAASASSVTAAPATGTPPSNAPDTAARAPLLNADGGRVSRDSALWRPSDAASKQNLQLLASLERELGRVPPEANELIRRRNAGASAQELRDWLKEHGPKELRARLILSRWLSQIAGDGGAARVESDPFGNKDGGVPKLLGSLKKKDAAP